MDEEFRARLRRVLERYDNRYRYIDIGASYEFEELADELARLDADPSDDPRHPYVEEAHDVEMGIAGAQGTQILQRYRCQVCHRPRADPLHSEQR